ncbi:ppGpp 3'-pyrophosphohydrolase [Malacoplasma penetrans HF-2]|uniref:Penta-phosphate guanosine-3'-pyrophosphohydrolase n=2 Tax=Malacoplasma penetrans TaxID=28227 RepID=Q8CXQ4_MALP2|nr:ppGpp 3'-pyrophosphohydrolase [Malacoplasma penetrans HF-2]
MRINNMTTTNIKKRFLFLTGLLKQNNFSADQIKLVKKAFEFANLKHGSQIRKSGEPYMIHPLETAIYLAEWKMDVSTIITGLLHDVLEDTDCTREDMEKRFGKTILEMVETVTKVSKVSQETRSKETYDKENSEYIIRVIMSVSSNLRSVIVKIADRMHNMETINHLKKEKQIRIASETFNIYANIAGRLGLYHQKTRLLDLSFQVLEPEKYESIKNMIDTSLKNCRESLNNVSQQIKDILTSKGIDFTVVERIKGIYSTYKKIEKGIDIKNIHDLFALRIITNREDIECYRILGLIHINFTFLPQTFKDYISSPKLNLYQSLHTTITFRKVLLEIQIRNSAMDKTANFGVAAHWLYKQNEEDIKEVTSELMFDILNNSDKEISKKIKNIQLTKIYDVLLLNNNKWYVVNEGSTVLDLACRYKPEKIFYLKTVFKEGVPVDLNYNPIKDDVLSFEYNDGHEVLAHHSWEEYVTFEDAKKIFRSLATDNDEPNKLVRELKNALKDKLESAKEIKRRLAFLNFNTLESYLEFYKNFSNKEIVYGFLSKTRKWKKYYLELSKGISKYELLLYNIKDKNIFNCKKAIFTECCTKLPGMDIIGVLNKGVLFIHRFDCERVSDKSKKFILEWDLDKATELTRSYPATLIININSKIFKINPIIHFITSKGFEIDSFDSSLKEDNKVLTFKLQVNKINNLNLLITELTYKFEQISSVKFK